MRHSKPRRVPGQPSPEGILFATVFGEPEHAVGLLRGFFPPEVAAAIDWQSLRRVDRSYVDPALSHLFTDVLFDARIGGRAGYVYMLLERASDGRPTQYHVTRNVASLLEQWALDHPDSTELPPVVPYVMRLGQEP